jgi:ribosomal-protein-alanine N-acetyltransferase
VTTPPAMAPPPEGAHLRPDPEAEPLTARGRRVRVAPVTKADLVPYRHAVLASRDRLAQWNPVDPGDLERHLRFQSSGHRTFIVHALEPLANHDIVGRVNVTNVVRGRALAGTLGYDAYDPYAGRGLFAEGLRLVVDLILAPEPRGMGLHRVEASVQPGNTRSAGLVRSLGFTRRGAWPAYLWLPDGTGSHAWRDHVTYGVTAPEWPARPFAVPLRARPVVVLPAASTVAGERLATELGVPFLSAAALHALGTEQAARLLATCPGVVLEEDPVTDAVLTGPDVGGAALRLDAAAAAAVAASEQEVVAVALAAEAAARDVGTHRGLRG